MSPIPRYEYGSRLLDEPRSFGFWRDVVSELLATFLYVTVSTLLRTQLTASSGSSLELGIGIAFLWAAIGYGLGDFGGSHMNSAITLAMMIRGEIIFIKGLLYWIFQLGGALCAYYFVNEINVVTGFSTNMTWWDALMVEGCVTMVLCLTALGTSNIPRKGYIILQSIPVGLAAGTGTMASFTLTKACMNPTQALAYQLMEEIKGSSPDWSKHWYYWAGPMIGAVLAAIFYWIFDTIEKPGVPGIYNTWTYGDGKHGAKNSSRENLTRSGVDDDYHGRSPIHHEHHAYNRY